MHNKIVSILNFAWQLGFELYDWQAKVLLRYEAGDRTALCASNFSGKTGVVFTVAALWTLYCFPRSRLMYMSATFDQVVNQFFSGLRRFRGTDSLPAGNGLRARCVAVRADFCLAVRAMWAGTSKGSILRWVVQPDY